MSKSIIQYWIDQLKVVWSDNPFEEAYEQALEDGCRPEVVNFIKKL